MMDENREMLQMQNGVSAYGNVPKESVFHAVYISEDNNGMLEESTKECIHVYQDKAEALNIIKEFKTGRLRTFTNYSEAEKYAKTGFENITCVNNASVTSTTPNYPEEPRYCKSLRSQELVEFRKFIESGDLKTVRKMVFKNPRYLIGSGDTPTILQEGCRYNALHVAVKADKPDICEFILDTVGNAEFFELRFGKDDCNGYSERIQMTLDMFLNTPDKGLNETPLHIAVKYGLKDIVRILVSYPQCLKRLPNKYKQMPIDIICNRKCQDDEELKKEICMLLEEQYYVPVLRSEDNSLQPLIGELFSPTRRLSFNVDPISPRLELRAFAGPMTKSQAMEFRKKWKTPPRLHLTPAKEPLEIESNFTNNSNNSLSFRIQDAEKGLERVGRDLATQYQVPWKEYWAFLDDFADFRTAEGLMKLEDYLAKKSITMWTKGRCKKFASILKEFEDLKLDRKEEGREENDTEDTEFFTPPSSPDLNADNSEDEMQNAEENGTTIVFLNGSVPRKLDYAVYNAVPSWIDDNTYPNIYRWQHEMQLFIKRDSYRPNNTRLPRRKLILTP